MPIVGSIFFLLVAIVVRDLKWTYVLRLMDQVSWKNGYHTIMISNMMNFILPIRFGEILKLYIINKVGDVSYSSSISATLTDRFSNLLIFSILLLFAPIAGFEFSQWSSRFVLFLIPLALILVALFVLGVRLFDIFERGVRGVYSFFWRNQCEVNELSRNKFLSFCKGVFDKTNIAAFTKGNLLIILLLSFITICLDGVCFYSSRPSGYP